MSLSKIAILSLLGVATALPQASSSVEIIAPTPSPILFNGAGPGNPNLTLPASTAWIQSQCNNPLIANAAADPAKRWVAADCDGAWTAALQSWNGGQPATGDLNLPFSATLSNFFHGPEGWNCEDIGSIPCSTIVQCDETNHPAGFLIMNALSSLHQVHQHYSQALESALAEMTPNMGTFASTFAPQLVAKDSPALVKALLGLLQLLTAVGSAYTWNIVAKEANWFSNANFLGFTKDTTNGAISFAYTVSKDNLPSYLAPMGLQNTIESALSSLVNSWKDTEAKALQHIFSGATDSNSELYQKIQNGMMNRIPYNLNLADMSGIAQKILYSMLMPIAWRDSNSFEIHPFIMATDDPCGALSPLMATVIDEDTRANSEVCYGGKAVYLLNADMQYADTCQDDTLCHPVNPVGVFSKLPGGNRDSLDGTRWGGVVLEDLVVSSYEAWLLNGKVNGYQMPELSTAIDGAGAQGDFYFQNGIRTPGFFNITVCTDVNAVVNYMYDAGTWNLHKKPITQFFPCDPNA